MRKTVLLVGLCMLVTLMFSAVAGAQSRGPSGANGTYNCEDFDDQGQAQQFFNQAGPGDPHGLDADGDGIACENLPTIVNNGTPDGRAVPGPGESAATDQYATPTPAASTPGDVTGGSAALPETGGISVISLAALGLLIAGGLLSARLVRR